MEAGRSHTRQIRTEEPIMRVQHTYRVIFTSPLGTHSLKVRASSEERAEQAGLDHLRKIYRERGQSGLPFLLKKIEFA